MDERGFKAAGKLPVRGTPMRRGNSIKGHTGAELGAIHPPIASTEPPQEEEEEEEEERG